MKKATTAVEVKPNAIKTTITNIGRIFIATTGLCATTAERTESLTVSCFDSAELMLQDFASDMQIPQK